MSNKEYEINVTEDEVVISGSLTIEEAFDWLNYFDKKGFDRVVIGDQNSTLRMMRSKKTEGEENEKEE